MYNENQNKYHAEAIAQNRFSDISLAILNIDERELSDKRLSKTIFY